MQHSNLKNLNDKLNMITDQISNTNTLSKTQNFLHKAPLKIIRYFLASLSKSEAELKSYTFWRLLIFSIQRV